METVHIQCSECHQQIAVQRSDLGYHVQCPLCQKVILAQAAESSAAPAAAQHAPTPEGLADAPTIADAPKADLAQQHQKSKEGPDDATEELPSPFEMNFRPPSTAEAESIFGPPDSETEDIFGGSASPKVQLPLDEAPTEIKQGSDRHHEGEKLQPQPDAAPAHRALETPPHPSAPEPMDESGAVFHDRQAETPASGFAPATGHGLQDEAQEQSTPASSRAAVSVADSEAVRRTRASGMIATILLIFFIPYSIFTTAAIAWLLITRETYNKDPLERMLEHNGGKSRGIKRIKHDEPVPAKLRTLLDKPLRIGAVAIRPLKVTMNKDGDLALFMRLENISTDLQFNPLPADFADYDRRTRPHDKPYIFLEEDLKDSKFASRRIYGAEVKWFRGPKGHEQRVLNAELRPKQSITAVLQTYPEDRKRLASLLKSGTSYLWRVHLRRGLEKIAGAERVITCVVGVEFQLADIEKT